jgi:hypothetical protein
VVEAESELELLLSLDGASYEAAAGYLVEFTVKRTAPTAERPHGISYALVFRPKQGEPFVRFDNAHPAQRPAGRFVKAETRPTIIGIVMRAIRGVRTGSPRPRNCLRTSGARSSA